MLTILLALAGMGLALSACGGDDVSGGPAASGNVASEDERQPIGVPPPAYDYCSDLGYQVVTETEDGDTVSHCVFPDGSRCPLVAFYEGQCGQAFSYCEQHGGTVDNVEEDTGAGWTASFARCTVDGRTCNESDFVETGRCGE